MRPHRGFDQALRALRLSAPTYRRNRSSTRRCVGSWASPRTSSAMRRVRLTRAFRLRKWAPARRLNGIMTIGTTSRGDLCLSPICLQNYRRDALRGPARATGVGTGIRQGSGCEPPTPGVQVARSLPVRSSRRKPPRHLLIMRDNMYHRTIR